MSDATRAAVTAKHLATVARCLTNADAALTRAERAYPDPEAATVFRAIRALLSEAGLMTGGMQGITRVWRDDAKGEIKA